MYKNIKLRANDMIDSDDKIGDDQDYQAGKNKELNRHFIIIQKLLS